MSILDQEFPPSRFAVVDLETTGLTPSIDRVIEIAIYHVDGPGRSACVLNTLVNPMRRVSGTEIHGITDNDVREAPTFAQVAGHVASALSGRVLAAHNVYFDLRFLVAEFERCGIQVALPHICTMYLAPMLGIGERRTLDLACAEHGIERQQRHCADDDAKAASQLLSYLLRQSSGLGVRTYRDLAKRKKYKFADSFSLALPDFANPSSSFASRPRMWTESQVGDHGAPRTATLRDYFDALVAAVTDLELSPHELVELKAIAKSAQLQQAQLRAAHGKVFAAFLNRYLDDSMLDDREQSVLARVWDILSQLGWAPGQ